MKSLSVLVIPSWYPTSDAPLNGIFFEEQVRFLNETGTLVDVLYPERRSLRSLSPLALASNYFQNEIGVEGNVRVIRKKGWNFLPRIELGDIVWVNQVQRLAELYINNFGKPDLIHAHGVLWGGIAAHKLSKEWGVPYVITEHSSLLALGNLTSFQDRWVKVAYGHSHKVIAVSTYLKSLLVDRGFVSHGKVEVIGNIVDTKFFSAPPQRPTPRPFRFVTVAILRPGKGIDTLLEAFAKLLQVNSDVELTIVGGGPDLHRLESITHRLGISTKVKFVGPLSKEQVRQAYWDSHVLVHSSYFETFGLVVAEALSTGMPAVVTKCGGPEDIMAPHTGMLIEPRNSDALYQALTKIIAQYDQFDRTEIRAHLHAKYSVQKITAEIYNVYCRALDSQGH